MDFIRQLGDIKDKQDISLAIERGETRKTISLRLVPEKSFFNAELIRKKTGATVQELTPDLAQAMAIRAQGLLIAAVDLQSPAADADLQRGMLITSIDGQDVGDIVSTAKRLYAKTKGDKIQLEVIIPRQRGAYVQYLQGRVELTLR
jgi:S1-C subfamily serine protease